VAPESAAHHTSVAAPTGGRLRVAFAGTPEFARVALQAIHHAGTSWCWCSASRIARPGAA